LGDNPVVSTSKATISPALAMPGDFRIGLTSVYRAIVTDPVAVAIIPRQAVMVHPFSHLSLLEPLSAK
jgi:hypothetical protein